MVCLWSAESVREFVLAVTSTEVVTGYIRLSETQVIMIIILTSVEFSVLALLVQPAGFASRIHAIK